MYCLMDQRTEGRCMGIVRTPASDNAHITGQNALTN